MAKRTLNHNASQEGEEKKKITRSGLKKALQIFKYTLPYKYTFIIGQVFLVLSTLTVLSFPVLIGKFLDVSIGNTDIYFSSISKVALIFGIILVLQAIFSFFRIYLFALVSENAMADLRKDLYTKMITMPIYFFEKKRVGELNSRITSDVTQLQDTFSFTIAEFFRQIMTLIIGTVLLFTISVHLTLLIVTTFPILVISAIIFGKYIRKIAKKSQDVLANSNVIVEETFQSIHSVKSFTNEWFEINRYQKALKQVVSQTVSVAKYRGLFTSFIISVMFGALVMVLAYGANLVAQKWMTVGDLTTFMFMAAFIGGSMGGMSELYGQLQKAMGASERILEILSETPEIASHQLAPHQNTPPILGKIAFKNVHFAYPSRPELDVLKGVSLEVQAGQKIALVGYSGVGKSTIIQLLGRYYPVNQGDIMINDKNVNDFDLIQLRQNIGIVPQEVLLFGGSIRENVAYGKPQASEQEIIEATQKANAWSFIDSFPEKLDTIVGERGIKLSGGQRQRIAIARAILKNPAILILDEATSSLDADAEKLVQEALDELMKNRTTIIIAHRLATIRKVDKIYVINEGKVLEAGSHEELLLQDKGIYQNLVKLQFELQQN
jgi:ABC-type multidrug transport system fused ATPase/permease subunit